MDPYLDNLDKGANSKKTKILRLPFRGRILEISPQELKIFKGDLEEIKNLGLSPSQRGREEV